MDFRREYLQMAILLAVFSSSALEKLLIKRYRRSGNETGLARARTALLCTLVFAFGAGLWNVQLQTREKKERTERAQAIETFQEARISFLDGLAAKNSEEIAESLGPLRDVAEALADDPYYVLTARGWLGLGYEVQAHKGADQGRFFRVTGNRVCEERIQEGHDIGHGSNHAFQGGRIRCTDISAPAEWTSAGKEYASVFQVLGEVTEPDTPNRLTGAIALAGRSTGYFYLCDYLHFETPDSLARARISLRRVVDATAGSHGLRTRHEDAIAKWKFAETLATTRSVSGYCED